ncbi:MAG TPA: amino acid adenylation domain-containing protein [Terriglobales bacterium]|nr:amino acid adenylation domain-containing protein [Terriglobales bacterium]
MSDSLGTGFQLSPQQRQLWSLAADGSVFNAVVSVLVEGTLDAERLKLHLQNVVRRHEILRTTFERQAGMTTPIQVVREDLAPGWDSSDLRPLNSDQQKVQGEQILDAEMRRPFQLATGPIVRAHLLTLADDKHMLVVAVPSLCADAISLANVVREIAEAYDSKPQSEEVFQYADYAGFANELVEDESDEEAKSGKQYWTDALSDMSEELRLPLQKRSQGASFHPERVAIEVPTAIDSVSNPANFFAACWHILLWRLSGQNRIILNRISDGRNHDELNGAIGSFSRSLPLAYEFDDRKSFARAADELQKAWSAACERQDYFADNRPAQDFAASFMSQEIPTRLAAGMVSFSIVRLQAVNQPFQMQVLAVLQDGMSRVELHYDSRYFSGEAAQQVAQRFSALATRAASNPELPIGELPSMSDAERQQLLVSFNNTAAEYPRAKCIHELIEETAARVPDLPALRFGETCFTYAQLNSRANQLAHRLRRKGVKPGVVVPLCLDRSAEMIIALLGILKAGGAYVPLVPDNPKARLAQQISDTQSPLVISEEDFLANLPARGEIICLDRDSALISKESQENPEGLNSTSDTAYVIYTSGSTGTPKGVAVAHSNLVNYSWFISQKLNAAAAPLNFATVSTLAADLGNTAIFPALISGGCLHVIGYETAMAADRFAAYMQRHPVDVLKITPSQLGSLLTAPEASQVLPRKYLILGGEAASWDLVRRVQNSGTCKVINHYGPTEATVGCCTFAVGENDVSEWSPATVPIGRPIANAQAYIVDQRMQPVPVGVPGEFCIGGYGIAQGYLNQPQQTAERFVANPFSSDPAARLYRTGDLARFLPDGNIEFLGRIDQQVKIRGFRVEPAEIESVLKKNSAVQQAIIIPRDENGDRRLIAYVIPANKSTQLEAELRAYLQERLPDYMVPAAIVYMDSLPLTRNGKIDTAALPSPEEIATERAIVAPRNPVEQGLAEIWRQVLRMEQVGVEDNFFDLGGHSLLATQVIARIRSTFHVQVPLRSLFDTPTVAGLAQQIAAMPQNSEEEEVARLLQELEELSDEEAERLLGREMRNAAESSGND